MIPHLRSEKNNPLRVKPNNKEEYKKWSKIKSSDHSPKQERFLAYLKCDQHDYMIMLSSESIRNAELKVKKFRTFNSKSSPVGTDKNSWKYVWESIEIWSISNETKKVPNETRVIILKEWRERTFPNKKLWHPTPAMGMPLKEPEVM